MEKWKTLETEITFNNKWIKIQKDTVELTSGKVINDYYVNVRPDVALIFPITVDRKVIMVRQYKHGVKEILLEFPGGIFDPAKELPQVAALRELREETGYSATNIEELGAVYDNPTKDTNRIFFFLATNAIKSYQTELDETEDIEIIEIDIEEIPAMIKSREIKVAGSIALFYSAFAFINS